MMIAAIDPGFSGAICFYTPCTRAVEIFDMPIHRVQVGKTIRSHIDQQQLSGLFARWRPNHAIVEDVSSMPGQGISSAFRFGFGAGVVQGIISAHQIPLHLVTPARWKKVMGLTSNKDDSRRMASMLFPEYAHLWPLVKHDGRAEALLLARFFMEHELK